MIEIVSYYYIGPEGMLPSDFLREVSGYISCPDRSLYLDAFIDTYITDRWYLASSLPELRKLSTYLSLDRSLIVDAQVRLVSGHAGFVLRCFLAEAQIQALYPYFVEGIRRRRRTMDLTPVTSYEEYRRWASHIDYFIPEGVIEGGWVSAIQAHLQDLHTRRISRNPYSIGDLERVM